jgi:formylglycine-generating enzyme required for sulfatase activity
MTELADIAKANNIYDLAGNNWEWTQERCGSNYVMRSGGYNLMGVACPAAAILLPSATRYLATITILTSASAWLCSSL